MICGKLPSLGQPLADDHVIQADHRALDIGDVSAQQIGRFDDAGKALGQDRVQGDLAQIVEQAADECFRRVEAVRGRGSLSIASASSSAQQATASECFQNSARENCDGLPI